MKNLSTVFLLFLAHFSFAQNNIDSLLKSPFITFHLATHSSGLPVKETVFVKSLSIVDSVMYNNWEDGLKTIREQYKDTNALLAVSAGDSRQRSEFFWVFYQKRMDGSTLSEAYLFAKNEIEQRYKTPDFKHILLLKK